MQTVEGQSRAAVTAANTAAKPLDNTGSEWTAVECRPSVRTAVDGPGRPAYSSGSDAPVPVASLVDEQRPFMAAERVCWTRSKVQQPR